MTRIFSRGLQVSLLVLTLAACSDSKDNLVLSPPDEQSVFAVANTCMSIAPQNGRVLVRNGNNDGYDSVAANGANPSKFLLRPSDLGKYLLYDEVRGYLTSDGERLLRQLALESDLNEVDGELVITDRLQSEGEWQLMAAANGRFQLKHLASGNYLASDGGVGALDDAADIALEEQLGCAEFPELTVDATGDVAMTEFEDGDVYGFVETHAHLFSNMAFGGGGAFHGAPFHPLGVEHALPDCDLNHGEDGRKDFIGFAFSGGLTSLPELLPLILEGQLAEPQHSTSGYPSFTDWPNAPFSSTHQMQYYKWIERAYLSGLRLMVQHVTSNEVLCELVVGAGLQPQRMDCADMVAADRIIEETYALERYIDAQSGGPGEGWFRVVMTPAEAREEIRAGNLAVVLGIEVSDLFGCYLVPFDDDEPCTEQDVADRLDEYHALGVRALFPVHKLDNAFSAGDGDRRLSEIGSFSHTGHFSNFVLCPDEFLEFPGGFDTGGINFSSLNMPRDVYDSPPPFDFSGFAEDPFGTLLPFAGLLGGGPLEGEYCQNQGLTHLGEFLMTEMMKRGMIIEVDHLPRKGYTRALELLMEYDYPAAGTHGRNFNGLLYALGGVSKSNLGRCRNPDVPATMDDGFQERIRLIRINEGYPAEGFGFDLNGFAGAPGPRFGDRSGCSAPQVDAGITYPFTSYAGDVTFEQPVVGERTLDFNTEGMVHLGLVAELIEDVRRDGVTDEELEPLFRSAEGYIRMWERAEARAAAINQM